MKRIAETCAGLLMVFLVAGCGSRVKIEGNVTYHGKPIDSGSISFEPSQGQGRDFGGVITDGKYQTVCPSETSSGTLTVRIRAAVKTGKQIPAGPPHPAGTMIEEVVTLPAHYNDKSTLTATLEGGKVDQVNFDLK